MSLLDMRPTCLSAGNGPCLGFRKPEQPYQWLSYQEVSEGPGPCCPALEPNALLG